MKLRLPLSLARPLAFAAVTTRLLMGIFLDLPWLYNAGWIAALGAILLCVPLGMLADRAARACRGGGIAEALEKRGGRAVARPVFALLSLVCIYETAVTSRVLSNTVRHVALAEASAISPSSAAFVGGNALRLPGRTGHRRGGAHLGARDAVLMLIVLLLQFRSFRPAWLTPLLGPGANVLASGTVSASGWLSMAALPWLCADREENGAKQRGALSTLVTIGIFSAAVLALLAMMAPPSVRTDLTRTYQLDKLLANGRVTQTAQLPLILLWYNGTPVQRHRGSFFRREASATHIPAPGRAFGRPAGRRCLRRGRHARLGGTANGRFLRAVVVRVGGSPDAGAVCRAAAEGRKACVRPYTIAVLVLLCALLSGCTQARQVESIAFAVILGADLTEDEGIELTVQIPKVGGGSESEESSSGEPSDYLIASARGEDVYRRADGAGDHCAARPDVDADQIARRL